MQKISTVLALIILLGASMAGCTGEDIEQPISTTEPPESGENNQEQTENNETGNGNVTNTTENNELDNEKPETKEYTAQEVLALIGVDGSSNAVLDLDAVAIGQEKFGMNMLMIVPIETLELGEIAEGMSGDVDIISSNMYDNTNQAVTNSMVLSMKIGGVTMSVQMIETQGPHPEIPNAGIINRVMTNMETFQPEAEWLIDYDWDYAESIEDIGMTIQPPEECDGHGYEMGSMGNMGPHCMCDEGFDWDDGDMMTCIPIDVIEELTPGEFYDNCYDSQDDLPQYECIDDFGEHSYNYDECEQLENDSWKCHRNDIEEEEIEPGPPEPSASELSSTEWTSEIDDTTGEQSFIGTVNMENTGNWSVKLSIIPTIPAKVVGLVMTNDSESYEMSFMYGNDVEINLITEDTVGWERGTSNLLADFKQGSGQNSNVSYSYAINGGEEQQIEMNTSHMEIHVTSADEWDENGNLLQPTILAIIPVNLINIETWVDSNNNTWSFEWICDSTNNLLSQECELMMYSTDEDVYENVYPQGLNDWFEIKLYDKWAEDYTAHNTPGFTSILSLIALLGACLLVQRKKLE